MNREHNETTSTPLDGLLGGMAGCIVKERNTGGMLLRLLSGSGLNVDYSDKQYALVMKSHSNYCL